MFFLKKTISLSAFIRMIANEVLKGSTYTYDDYLSIDPDSILSQPEFEEFIRNLHLLRLLLLYVMLIDRKNKGQFKVSMEDLAKIYIQALELSYQDNDVDCDEAKRLSEVFSSELDHFSSYIESLPVKIILEKGYTPYACLYITSKFAESSEESVKNGMYIALINTQRKIMKEYFEKALEKVKISIN